MLFVLHHICIILFVYVCIRHFWLLCSRKVEPLNNRFYRPFIQTLTVHWLSVS